ncbi:alpha,alpha-trehalase TreF [Chitinophaga sp. Cy-1792]|uniref:alpha,alpha-trehalase TreF n=1 Tax=Chitinophaga sp. Cy-1792 TaxID=2608339 RepID=UPI00141F4D2A|nr:alpha,alpha-trehalase TreF [Chitinophaga sp. Cy-1792]NIG54588.1 alpha,alpha-trehalase TreF [Chitinophaga sp. Cy-1792]
MKSIITAFLLIIYLQLPAQQQTPRTIYPGLFEDIQLNRIYPDGKTFVDMKPKMAPAAIMEAWLAAKDKPGFNLKTFADSYFEMPASRAVPYHSDISAGIEHHIDTLWTVLRREPVPDGSVSLIPLPHPYIVPGGRFREVYYWDSYFTMLGLQAAGKTEMIENMISNFAWLIDTLGFIPNGNRTYFLTRSQPPFFSMMISLLAETKGESVYAHYLPELLKEYAFWMRGADTLSRGNAVAHVVKLRNGEVLNRYWDFSDQPREESYREDVLAARETTQHPSVFYRNIRAAAESGWDFSSRWFKDPQQLTTIHTTDIIPVDLNGLLYHLELTIARGYKQKGKADSALLFKKLAAARRQAVIRYCWNTKSGWYFDYDWKLQQQTKAVTIAGATPLFFGMTNSTAMAKRMAAFIKQQLLAPGGVMTTQVSNHQQWDAPNAWAPLQYMAIKGLHNYGQQSLADTIAKRWTTLNITVFNHTGKLLEKYNVADIHLPAGGGEYPLQDGFGWTNGVLLQLIHTPRMDVLKKQ